MTERTFGQIIDGLGVDLDIEDGLEVTDVIVLAKTLDMESGEVSLLSRWSPTISWIERRGMLRIAETQEAGFTVDMSEDE